MMHHRLFCISIACLAFASAAVSGCGDKSSTGGAPPPSSSGATATATGGKTNESKVGFDDADLAVPEDFEVAAREGVRSETYKHELDVLAKELDLSH